jgi:Family of unknown function (DUF5681)
MTRPPGDYEVGYKRPPKVTRWKKGQSGNPRSRREHELPDVIAIMDRLLSEAITVVDQGKPKKITVLEAILRQIWMKEMAGSKRAAALRMRYQDLIPPPTAPRRTIIRQFVGDDETGEYFTHEIG